jgi:hypothetical protein
VRGYRVAPDGDLVDKGGTFAQAYGLGPDGAVLGIGHGVIAEHAAGFALPFRDPDNIALEFWAPRS